MAESKRPADLGRYTVDYMLRRLDTEEGKADCRVLTDVERLLGEAAVNPRGLKWSTIGEHDRSRLAEIVQTHDVHLSEVMHNEQKAKWASLDKALREGRFVESPDGEASGERLRKLMAQYPGDAADVNGTSLSGKVRGTRRLVMFTRRDDPDWFMYCDMQKKLVEMRNDVVRAYLHDVRVR